MKMGGRGWRDEAGSQGPPGFGDLHPTALGGWDFTLPLWSPVQVGEMSWSDRRKDLASVK